MNAPRSCALRGADGLRVVLTDAGAAWMSCVVPVTGGEREVLLGHAEPADYLRQPGYVGAIVGRHANRLAGAAFELDGRRVSVDANEGANQLHGGAGGFHRRVWDVAEHGRDHIEFTLRSPDGDQGYPGALEVRAIYRVEPGWTVSLTLEARTDAPTLVNLTSHAYFNLDGAADREDADIRGHRLQMNAPRYLPVRPDLIPTGEQRAVADGAFDFTRPRRIGEALQALLAEQGPDTRPACHDHCWLPEGASASGDGPADPVVAVLSSGDGALGLALHSAQPGLQFYAGEFLAETPNRRGRPHPAHAGLALEPQTLPDSPHHPDWSQPDAVLRPGQVYRHRLLYRFFPAAAGRPSLVERG